MKEGMFVAFEWFAIFKAVDQIVSLVQWSTGFGNFAVSEFYETANHAAFALKTSIKPLCFWKASLFCRFILKPFINQSTDFLPL